MRRHDKEYFGEWLNRTLTERNIAGGEVARALGVNDSAVSRWRNGKATPGLDSVMALAGFLCVDPVSLAVTAGLMQAGAVGKEKLPLPKESEDVELARQHIMKIPGLTEKSRKRLLEALSEEEKVT